LRKGKQEVEEEGNITFHKFGRKKKGKLTHVTQHVTSKTLTNLISEWNMNNKKQDVTIEEMKDDNVVNERDDNDLLICGLHSCGELSSTMLDLFVKNEKIKCVVNVGCCYHLLYDQENSKGTYYK
jgi:hypothetical protein